MGTIYVSLAAFGGAITASLLGWLESGVPFVARKFFASALRALVAGGSFAIAYSTVMGTPTIADIVIAFGAGAGVDVIGNRLAGSMKAS